MHRSPRTNQDDDSTRERLRRHLEALNLKVVLEKLDEYLEWATKESPATTTLLERIFGEEAAARIQKRVQRRIDLSGLKEHKTLEAFDFPFQPKLDKRLVLELATLDFVHKVDDLLITGKSGTGKSHILQAIALIGCRMQLAVRYARCVDLLDDLYAGLADGTYLGRMKKWTAPNLLVIDDVGLGQVKKREDEPTAAHTLFDLLDRRHQKSSTAMSSNINLGNWGRYLGDTTLAAAILDRVAMRAIRIDIDGPSYRQKIAKQRAERSASPKKKPNGDRS
jgi:DNA replication protein DnaC